MSKPTHPALEALRDIVERTEAPFIAELPGTRAPLAIQAIRQDARAAIPQLEDLLKERDELLTALENLLSAGQRMKTHDLATTEDWVVSELDYVNEARAAIAKAEES